MSASSDAFIELEGEYTSARVIGLSREDIEENTLDQIQEMIDHEAFSNPVRVMPDTHVGAGAVIGFTMPLDDKVVPNVVGVDIGCGMFSTRLGSELSVRGEELDERVRNRVPMGNGPGGLKAPDRAYYHIVNEFPWDEVNETLAAFIDSQDGEWVSKMREFYENGGYGEEYFDELVYERAQEAEGQLKMNTAINSIGTLGGGNHFIEIGRSVETGDYWVTIHSGSRGLGAKTASYWQDRATDHIDDKYHRDDRVARIREHFEDYPDEYLAFDPDAVSGSDLLDWVQGGMGQDFINYDPIPPKEREKVRHELKVATDIANEGGDTAESLDYLEGKEAAGYLIDMIFCQKYASVSRKLMAGAVAEALGVDLSDTIESVHNFIDFRDGVIRKGATRSYEGERAIIPFNMRDGTLIVEGKSNAEWHRSSPHGAGRVMSRRQANSEFTEADVREMMADAGAFATVFPTDESPGAYKNAQLIEDAIEETATIIDRLEVVHNWKAE